MKDRLARKAIVEIAGILGISVVFLKDSVSVRDCRFEPTKALLVDRDIKQLFETVGAISKYLGIRFENSPAKLIAKKDNSNDESISPVHCCAQSVFNDTHGKDCPTQKGGKQK